MSKSIGKETLRDFLHDALPDAELAVVEKALREDGELRKLMDEVRGEEDRGEHSVGAIWRRSHVSCPTRDQLGGYVLDAIDPALFDYIDFHLKTIGCPYCQANLEDLQKKQTEAGNHKKRRKRIMDSSAGTLKNVARP